MSSSDNYLKQLDDLERDSGIEPQSVKNISGKIEVAVKKAAKKKPSKKDLAEKTKAAKPEKKTPLSFARAFMKDYKSSSSSTMQDEVSDLVVDLGHAGINYLASGKMIGNGAGGPRKKLWETFGPSGSLKSAKGYITGGSIQKIGGLFAVVDAEGARNHNFMKLCGVDVSTCINLEPLDGDGDPCYSIPCCFSIIHAFISSVRKEGFDGPIFVLFDSIAASPSHDEWMQLKSGKEVKEDQGRRAKTINQFQRCLTGLMRSDDNTVEVINQIRSMLPKPGQFYGPTETTTSGKSMEYYSDFRIDIRKRKAIQRNFFEAKKKDANGREEYTGRARKLGSTFSVTAEKSRQTAPMRHIPGLEFYFEHGIAPMSGLMDTLIMDEVISEEKSGGRRTGRHFWMDPVSRLSSNPLPMEGVPSFRRRDFEDMSWIMDRPHLLGTNRETIQAFITARRQEIDGTMRDPHEFSLGLKKIAVDRPDEVSEVDDEDDDGDVFDRNSKADQLAAKSGGNLKKAVLEATVEDDEVPEE
jgi:RecA/RadA recombinase